MEDIGNQAVHFGAADNAIRSKFDRPMESQMCAHNGIGCLMRRAAFTAAITKLMKKFHNSYHEQRKVL